jgi:hypothetical protein
VGLVGDVGEADDGARGAGALVAEHVRVFGVEADEGEATAAGDSSLSLALDGR